MQTSGPLQGVRVLEFAWQGPGPFAATLLSDLGAMVLRVERPGTAYGGPGEVDVRGRKRLALDLKSPAAIATCLALGEKADLLIEGYRPGVMVRLGLGPEVFLMRNPALVYGRMTGWGQQGPWKHVAGHDINYLALTGVLHAIGTADKPIPPLSIGAHYGGGGMFLIVGLLGALHHAKAIGEGQVIDVAMTDGAAYLINRFYGMLSTGEWTDQRVSNWVDGGAAFFNTYKCADGGWISVGAMEPGFYALLLDKIGATDKVLHPQITRSQWAHNRQVLADVFATKTRQECCNTLGGSDVCFAPVLSMTEAQGQ